MLTFFYQSHGISRYTLFSSDEPYLLVCRSLYSYIGRRYVHHLCQHVFHSIYMRIYLGLLGTDGRVYVYHLVPSVTHKIDRSGK